MATVYRSAYSYSSFKLKPGKGVGMKIIKKLNMIFL